jgi:branched-chain amino acid transport system substrate-binding protein
VRDALLATPIAGDRTFNVLGDIKFTNEGPFPTQGMVVSVVTIKDGKYTTAAKDVPVPAINKW